MAFLDLEMNEITKQDIYLAQIATEVVRPNLKDPKKIGIKDLLIKWDLSTKEGTEVKEAVKEDEDGNPILDNSVGRVGTPEQEERKRKALANKHLWLGAILTAKPRPAPEKE
jgi:hypothetical protein